LLAISNAQQGLTILMMRTARESVEATLLAEQQCESMIATNVANVKRVVAEAILSGGFS